MCTRSRMLCSQVSSPSGMGSTFVASGFVPEGEFNPIPESEFVIDNSEVVFNDVLSGSNCGCDFSILESLGNEFNDSLLPFIGDTFSVALASEHSCLRYKRVASLTRLMPLSMP